jgi:hypothetical protein
MARHSTKPDGLCDETSVSTAPLCGNKSVEMVQYPKGRALFIKQGGYEAGYIGTCRSSTKSVMRRITPMSTDGRLTAHHTGCSN